MKIGTSLQNRKEPFNFLWFVSKLHLTEGIALEGIMQFTKTFVKASLFNVKKNLKSDAYEKKNPIQLFC